MLDSYGRDIHYLRISVTDRCNLRCVYCMPEDGVPWASPEDILTSGEILRLVKIFARLGVWRVRLTGGEPLLRGDLPQLAGAIRSVPGVRWLGLTTNGLLLQEQLPALLSAGLDGVNLSLDALDRERYRSITRRDKLSGALAGLDAALEAAAESKLAVKLNCVPTAANADQWVPIAALAQSRPIDVRFIELMPIGLGSSLSRKTEAEVLSALGSAFGPALPCSQETGSGPGRYVVFPGFQGRVGFISAVSHQFCASCNRVRLTATGFLKTCLQYSCGADLRALLRSGADGDAIRAAIEQALLSKPAAHHFGAGQDAADDRRNMNQIGG